MSLIALKCTCFCSGVPKRLHMNSDVFGLSNTKHLRRNSVLCCNDDVASLPPQNLTQWSGPITRLASDLSRACQKYNCTVLCLISLRQVASWCPKDGALL